MALWDEKLSKSLIHELLFISLLFAVNSVAGLFIFGVWALSKERKFNTYVLWGVFFALFVSLYNATKIPANDLKMYLNYFHLAGGMPLIKYINILGGKDSLYLAYGWFWHLIIKNYDPLFTFIMSLTSYLFFLKGLLVACKSLNLDRVSIFACFSVLFFFPFSFSVSAHILRQTIAFSIMSYVVIEKVFNKKNYWYLGLVATLFHSSVFFFMPFLFFNFLYRPLSKKNIVGVAAIIFAIVGVKNLAKIVSSLHLGITAFNFALDRAANGTYFEATLSSFQLAISVILVLMLFVMIYLIKPILRSNASYVFFSNITLLLLLFIVINPDQGELQVRFNIFMWQLTPIFVALYLGASNVSKIIKLCFSLLIFIAWFIYNAHFSPWEYSCSKLFWFYPAFYYLL